MLRSDDCIWRDCRATLITCVDYDTTTRHILATLQSRGSSSSGATCYREVNNAHSRNGLSLDRSDGRGGGDGGGGGT
jgi:hypothetical protein